jgi:hypothetical protein
MDTVPDTFTLNVCVARSNFHTCPVTVGSPALVMVQGIVIPPLAAAFST